MTILVGTDFSNTSFTVGVVAAELARRRGEDLVLVHIVDGPLLPGDPARIAEEARRLSAHDCRVRTVLEHEGAPGRRLAELAQQELATLLVVGAQGRGLGSALGTVATAALRHSTGPLLVVRRPELLWDPRAEGNLRVLVTVALDATDAGVLDAMKLVASMGDLDADFVHYRPIPEPRDVRSGPVDEPALRAYFGELPTGLHVRTVEERDGFGRLDGHVSDLARHRQADLVVCGSHHRHGADRVREGSVAEGIVLHAPVSVLVARAPASLVQRMTSALA